MKRDLIVDYLVNSYIYYRLSESVIDDGTFDLLCKEINDNWEEIDSPFKYLVGPHPVKGFDGLEENYPPLIRDKAKERLQEYLDLKDFLKND